MGKHHLYKLQRPHQVRKEQLLRSYCVIGSRLTRWVSARSVEHALEKFRETGDIPLEVTLGEEQVWSA